MAPERFGANADWRADIYALACVLHECLTGAQPFGGGSPEQQYTAHKFAPPPRPSIVRPGVPTGLDEVIAKGMAKDPEQRYQRCPELAAAARKAITQPVPHNFPRPPGQGPQPHQPATTVLDEPVPPAGPDAAATIQQRLARQADGSRRNTSARSRLRRWIIIAAAAMVVVGTLAGLMIGRAIIRSQYYVGQYKGTVAIMRGIRGSLLGISFNEPYVLACVNATNELSLVTPNSGGNGCRLLKIGDLRPVGRAELTAGLPSGSLDAAQSQLRNLLSGSLLPACPTTKSTSEPQSPTTPPLPVPSATASPPPPPPQPGIDCRAVA
jgi:hypothetical protein